MHLFDFGDHPARPFQDVAPGRREHDLPRGAFDQLHAEFVLEFFQLRRQRRLADMAGFGRAAEMPLVGEGDQVAQVAEVHGYDSYKLSKR